MSLADRLERRANPSGPEPGPLPGDQDGPHTTLELPYTDPSDAITDPFAAPADSGDQSGAPESPAMPGEAARPPANSQQERQKPFETEPTRPVEVRLRQDTWTKFSARLRGSKTPGHITFEEFEKRYFDPDPDGEEKPEQITDGGRTLEWWERLALWERAKSDDLISVAVNDQGEVEIMKPEQKTPAPVAPIEELTLMQRGWKRFKAHGRDGVVGTAMHVSGPAKVGAWVATGGHAGRRHENSKMMRANAETARKNMIIKAFFEGTRYTKLVLRPYTREELEAEGGRSDRRGPQSPLELMAARAAMMALEADEQRRRREEAGAAATTPADEA